MNREEIREYLINFQKSKIPDLVEREIKIPGSRRIITIIGPRRAGKTYLLYQKMKELLNSTKKENIIYLNFEHPSLIDVNFKEIKEIVKLHWQLYPSSIKKSYIFIDEPQNIEKWEIAVRALHDEGFNIILTGSSSKLLSKEIATSLRGRTISYLLLPFSFREFLKAKNAKFDFERLSSKEKSLLLNLLEEYINFGGFPEIVLEENEENKLKMIEEYYNLIIYRDIVERYKIKNIQLIKWLIKSLINSFSKEFSVHKLYLTLKSKGIKVSKNTLYTYFSILEDSLFVFPVPKFTFSVRKKELLINKVYLSDICFTKLVEISKNIGRKIENVVFLELLRRRKPLTEIFYYKNQQGEEVDFVIKEGGKIKQLIQVCYDIDDYETKKREVKALVKAGSELKCKNLIIITWDQKFEEIYKERKIKFVPLWEWLIEL